jgi:hypothetical protein
MKKLIIAGCITSLLACSNTDDFDANLDSKVSKPTSPAQSTATQSNASALPMPAVSAPVSTQPNVTTTAVTPAPATTQTQTATTAAGMNPPHGQPGHRCDLAVGAPLNSAPKQTAKTTSATVIPQNIVTTTTQVKTAPGMNPPHGQPGHRCDISVGAPLNSAPATTTTVTPVKPEETKPATEQWKADIKTDKPATKADSSRN